MGSKDMKKINAGKMNPTGRGLTKGGLICGIIGTILSLIELLLIVVALIGNIADGSIGNFPN